MEQTKQTKSIGCAHKYKSISLFSKIQTFNCWLHSNTRFNYVLYSSTWSALLRLN